MLNLTIVLFALGTFLQATAAAVAWWGYLAAGERGWAWLCLVAACLLWAGRNAIPFWIAINVGLYDYRDGLFAALSASFCLAATVGLRWRRR